MKKTVNEGSKERMKVVYNRFVPICGFEAMMLFGRIWARREFEPISEQTLRHELIHTSQAVECGGWIRYYLRYILYWIRFGYRNNPFEREAYRNMADTEYLDQREPFAWKKYMQII